MVADLNMPLDIEICPTVREADGLALSSRNKYLSEMERADAVLISRGLKDAQKAVESGITDSERIKDIIRDRMNKSDLFDIDYIEVVDGDTFEPVEKIEQTAVIAVAARIGQTRLIDNTIVGD
jgi:pantoate--beta-alanine ligase